MCPKKVVLGGREGNTLKQDARQDACLMRRFCEISIYTHMTEGCFTTSHIATQLAECAKVLPGQRGPLGLQFRHTPSSVER